MHSDGNLLPRFFSKELPFLQKAHHTSKARLKIGANHSLRRWPSLPVPKRGSVEVPHVLSWVISERRP